MRSSIRHLPAILVLAFTMVLAACQQGQPDRASNQTPVDGVHDVTARGLQFEPSAIRVRPGTTVTWHFEDGSVPHDVSGDGFSSPVRKSGTFSHRFDQAGSFEYRCTLHANMTGRVIVES
jgi:plastocyanin